MGISPSSGGERFLPEDLQIIFSLPEGMWLITSDRYASDALSAHSCLDREQRACAKAALQAGVSAECDRAVGCLLGLVVGDAMGSPLEFHPVRYEGDPGYPGISPLAGLDTALWEDKSEMRETNRFLLEMGQWTDDGAMALCLADSLLAHGGFHPRDLRLRFLAWWKLGYNNAFGHDGRRRELWGSCESIGLGGTIGKSFEEFVQVPADYTCTGNIHSSGNGSVMRNAAVPIMYHRSLDAALEVAWRQSKTTHQGDEAADCARLLTWICIRAISGAGKKVLCDLSDFPARLASTRCLAEAVQEQRCSENEGEDLANRDWRWRQEDYRYAPARAASDPGYVGSYAMDCMAMALHCVHATSSFEAAVLRAANRCGDADTVAAVTGQLAGAIYGASAVPSAWREAVERWDRGGDIQCRAWLLFDAGGAPTLAPDAFEVPAGKSWTALAFSGAAEETGGAEPNMETSDCGGDSPKAVPEMPLQCVQCGRRFAVGALLEMHRNKAHGKRKLEVQPVSSDALRS